jgi:hypothetical protein
MANSLNRMIAGCNRIEAMIDGLIGPEKKQPPKLRVIRGGKR